MIRPSASRPDPIYAHPRLAAIYDAFDDPARVDLDPYEEFALRCGARRVADLGCGTGILALRLADRGLAVTGVDPAGASLDVARAKPGADRVRWIHGDAGDLPPDSTDVVTMTGNAAQAVTSPSAWATTLRAVRSALVPGGHLMLETRDPAAQGWTAWNRDATHRVVEVPGVGPVETWIDLLEVALPLVSFRHTWRFRSDGREQESVSTLRFRTREEVEASLRASGLETLEVTGAPDRPGKELVVVARRPR